MSTKFANVVLPAASFAEKEGSYTNFEGKIGWLQQALSPAGMSLPDWEIILRLAKRMGEPFPYNNLQQVIAEIEAQVPLYEGYHQPEEMLGEKWSYREERRSLAFQSLAGFPHFNTPCYTLSRQKRSKKYPYYLILEESTAHFGSGSRSGNAWRLRRVSPPPLVNIGPEDATALYLNRGDEVRIIAPGFQIMAVVGISHALPAGTLSVTSSFPGILDLFDFPFPGQKEGPPSQESCCVRLERMGTGE